MEKKIILSSKSDDERLPIYIFLHTCFFFAFEM